MMVGKALRVVIREIRVNANYVACRRTSSGGYADTPRRVALVRLDRIGDFALFTASLPHLRRAFPNAELTLFGNPAWADLAMWLNNHRSVAHDVPLFDRFVPLDPESLVERDAFRDAAHALADFDLVVHPVFARTNAVDKLVAASGRPCLAPEGDTTNMTARQKHANDRLYTRLIPNGPSQNELERGLHFVESLVGQAPVPRQAPRWFIPPEPLAETLHAVHTRTAFDSEADPYVVLFPFAGASLRQWPLPNCAELVTRLSNARPDVRIVILGAPGDQPDADALVREAHPAANVANLTGRTSLVETVALLARSRVSISGDTAGNHLASAVGAAYVTILGGGHFGRFYPYALPGGAARSVCVTHEMRCYGCNWLCPYRLWGSRPAPCLERIPVEAVLDAVTGLLAEEDRAE